MKPLTDAQRREVDRAEHMRGLHLKALRQIAEGRVTCDYRGRCWIAGAQYGGIGWSLWPVEDAMKDGFAERGAERLRTNSNGCAANWDVVLTDSGHAALQEARG